MLRLKMAESAHSAKVSDFLDHSVDDVVPIKRLSKRQNANRDLMEFFIDYK